jgi:serine/threonine protein kinase
VSAPPPSQGPVRRTVDIRREMKLCGACGHRFSGEAMFCPFDGVKLETVAYDPLGDPLLGSTIDGRYEVMELLGEGGMGRVYEVRHVALDRRFAMKVLRRDLARDEELASRFIQEAKATASVRHPNVVEITDFGRMPDGVPYFVMELLVGETLGHVIKGGGPIPSKRAVRILKQVTGALGAAHLAGIVHRDLKPDNVFLVGGFSGGSTNDDVRVVDFGAAKIVGSSRVTRAGIVFGTPHYMSPEQASGQPVDHRADVYALGIIMYEMFTGRVPFEADTYMGVLTQHMFVQPPRPSQVSAAARELGALEEITMICLAKKPEERFASMADLSAALDEVVMVRSDGRVQIAAAFESRASKPPPSLRYRMADELEPPTLAEMRVAIDSVLPPRRVIPWAWLGGAAALVVAGLATCVVIERRSSAPPAEAPPLASAPTEPAPPAPASLPTVAAATAVATGSAPAEGAPSASAAAAPASASVEPAAGAPAYVPARKPPLPKKPSNQAGRGIDDVGDPFANKR